MPESRHGDTAWRRLPWLLPPAFLLSSLTLAGFLVLLAGSPIPPPRPTEIAMQLVELPPPAPAPEPVPSEPEPTVEPEPAVEPPAEPVLPAPQVALPKPSPRPPTPRLAAIRPARPLVAPVPSPAVPSEIASPSSPPGGGNMAARVLFQPRPEIPDALRNRALDLVAVARFRISASGAAEIELITPTPDPMLNRAVMEALQRWRFFPAMADGKPVASQLEIRIPLLVR